MLVAIVPVPGAVCADIYAQRYENRLDARAKGGNHRLRMLGRGLRLIADQRLGGQHVLHVEQAELFAGQVAGGAQAALGVGGTIA